ncbi:MAG TPA: tetratricopeptide repeat protein, partial [Planctomycetota bacterium]|nr:tetratricopeptide repeat protein [Planctomycetota bacterium]
MKRRLGFVPGRKRFLTPWWRARLFLLALLVFSFSPTRGLSPQAGESEEREAALVFNTASRFYRQKNWRDAANSFSEFLKSFPRHADAPEARFAAGYCLNQVEDHAAAVEILRLAIRDEGTPWAADAHFFLGRSLEALAGDSKGDAGERSRRLVAAAENYARAAALHEKAYRTESSPTPAQGPEDPAKKPEARERSLGLRVLALGAQGEALYQAEKYAEADKALEVLLKEKETMAGSAHYQRGVYVLGLARHALVSKSEGAARYAPARAALGVAAEPRYQKETLWEEAAFLLGRLAHQDRDLDRAIEAYGEVVKKGGGRAPEAAYHRGLALYELKQLPALAQARLELGRFLRDYPGHALAPKARYYEAMSAFEAKDYEGSAPLFEAVAAESPDFRGRALVRQGQALLLQTEPRPAAAAEALKNAAAALETENPGPAQGAGDTSTEWLAEALYWRGEALVAEGNRAVEAAAAYGEVHTRFARVSPDLAEKALYQKARTLHFAGKYAESAEASDLYRDAYPPPGARFHAESLLLSAENAFRAPEGSIPEARRREAPRYYREAAAALKDPEEARRARYKAGVALYFLGEYRLAAEALDPVQSEVDAGDEALQAAFPELSFYLADSLAQVPRPAVAAPEDRERWKRAAGLYHRYLERSAEGSHLPNALVNLGLCQEWLEDQEGAKKTFQRFLELFPRHELANQVRFELGNARLVTGDLEAAALAYASAASAPESGTKGEGGSLLPARALYQKAMLERRLGKAAQAAETLTGLLEGHVEVLKIAEGGPRLGRDALYQRALALLEAGNAEAGRAELQLYLEQNPGSLVEAEGRALLARSLIDAKQPAEALEVLDPVLTAEEGGAGRDQALYLSAWCHSALAAKPEEGGSADTARAAQHQEEMEAAYRKLIAEYPEGTFTIDAMLELGQHLFNRKAFAESKRWLDQVRETIETDSAPADPARAARSRDVLERALFGLGFIAFEEGNPTECAKVLDRVAKNSSSPLAPRAAFQAGRALMKAEIPG